MQMLTNETIGRKELNIQDRFDRIIRKISYYDSKFNVQLCLYCD